MASLKNVASYPVWVPQIIKKPVLDHTVPAEKDHIERNHIEAVQGQMQPGEVIDLKPEEVDAAKEEARLLPHALVFTA